MIKELSPSKKYRIIIEIGSKYNRHRKTITFLGTKKEAKARELELKNEYESRNGLKKDITFKELGNRFLEDYCSDKAVTTVDGYKGLLKQLYKYIDKYRLKDIDKDKLKRLYKKLEIGEKGKLITKNTLRHYYNLINVMFNYAVEEQYLLINPNKQIKKPKDDDKIDEKVKCYSEDEVKKIYSELENDCLRNQALIVLAIDSGCRLGEQLCLSWKDVDLENRTISITKSMAVISNKDRNPQYIEKPPKTKTSKRKIVITSKTAGILKKYKEEQQQTIDNWNDKCKLFLSANGKPMYPTTLGKILKKTAQKCDVPILNWHSLRHTCASLLIALNVHPKVIQDRLGHSSLSVTMDIYSEIFQKQRVTAANELEKIFI